MVFHKDAERLRELARLQADLGMENLDRRWPFHIAAATAFEVLVALGELQGIPAGAATATAVSFKGMFVECSGLKKGNFCKWDTSRKVGYKPGHRHE